MNTDARFTDGRIPSSRIRDLLSEEHRWQRWLDAEAALAMAEAEFGIVPQAAAEAIRDKAVLAQLDEQRIRREMARASHQLMPLIVELSRAVGEPHGGWVHWGATTRNILQTGDALVLREVQMELFSWLGLLFEAMERLAREGRDMMCAGRTHGQQALPITFGLKVAAWVDEFGRHVERLQQVSPRVFTAGLGGPVGSFGSLGDKGPHVQARMAELLGLESLAVPSLAVSDAQAEYVCILGLMAGTSSKAAKEIYHLMQNEFGEAFEPTPAGTIGSSTMPHKRNPQLAADCIAIAAQIRSLVPLALEGMEHEHEVSNAHHYMTDDSLMRTCVLSGDLLVRLVTILQGLELDPERMLANTELSHGLMASEAVMLALGQSIGRQRAHEIIYEDAQAVTSKRSFREVLSADSRVTEHLSKAEIDRLLDPRMHAGLSAQLADQAVRKAHKLAADLRLILPPLDA